MNFPNEPKKIRGLKMAANQEKEIIILVVGSVGAGVTSLCNAMTGQTEPTSDSAARVTQHTYEYRPVERDGVSYVFVDIPGVTGHRRKLTASNSAFVQRELESYVLKRGLPDLVLVVQSDSSIINDHENPWETFGERYEFDHIPVIYVMPDNQCREATANFPDTLRENGHYADRVIRGCFYEYSEDPAFRRLTEKKVERNKERLWAVIDELLTEPAVHVTPARISETQKAQTVAAAEQRVAQLEKELSFWRARLAAARK